MIPYHWNTNYTYLAMLLLSVNCRLCGGREFVLFTAASSEPSTIPGIHTVDGQ